jgi:HlyD family secretion protein
MKRIFLTLALTSALCGCGPTDDVNRVVGELASDRIELTAEFNEAIVAIEVAEGSAVSKDQILLRQNDERAVARLADAEAVHLQAAARLDELIRGPRNEQIAAGRATVEGATQDLEFRRSEQARINEIHQRGLASTEELDKANAALDAAEATLKYRLAQLEELLAGTTIEELAQAEQSVEQAAAKRVSAQIDVDRHVISAPVDGVVDSRLFEIGERPAVGQPVIVVLAARQPHARVYVPEIIRVKIKSGTKALIHVDGLGESIEGRVRWVASEAAFTPYYALTERDRGRLSYVAKVDIVEERDRLPDGVPVEVEFELD